MPQQTYQRADLANKLHSISPTTLIAFLVPFLCALAFSVAADHAWEDWYITYRSSKNLATGFGLVYDVGERVHSFTSPLGTLIPALIRLVSIGASDGVVLWLFRVIQCLL